MDPLEKLANDYRKISNPTMQDIKHFNDVFAATQASLEAANKPAGPPVMDDNDVIAKVKEESLASYREQEDFQRAITNSLHGSGWGGGWRLGGAEGSSAERAALARQRMSEKRGRPSRTPAAAAGSLRPSSQTQEDADLREALQESKAFAFVRPLFAPAESKKESAELQAALALSLIEGEQRTAPPASQAKP